ncbi:MAG TPA: hypothetical protein VD908_03660 [Cytophagales bacterium]|nr:hypothetical protein [Cytophagales bacterium]
MPAGKAKDFCTTSLISVEVKYEGEIQRVDPERGEKLNRLLKSCGMRNDQNWAGASTEILVTENGKLYWLQVIKDASLGQIKKDESLELKGQLISEHRYDEVITFLILHKVSKKE